MNSWVSQVRKGIAEYVILLLLREGEDYGYAIYMRLAAIKNLNLGESTIYPLLNRLTRDGYLSLRTSPSVSGPPRRYYSLTPTGRAKRDEMERYWKELVDAVQLVWEGKK